MTSPSPEADARRVLKSPFDLAGGLFLLLLAGVGLVGGIDLPFGTLSAIRSGLVPRVVAILIGVFGLVLIVQALLREGDGRLERWRVRGPVFVLGAVVLFAMLIRGSTLSLGGFAGIPVLASVEIPALGLIVAGPLSVIVSSFAANDTRPVEIVVYSVILTLICGLVFKEFLNLPIPFDPAGLLPEAISSAYEGAKAAIAHVFGAIMALFGR